MIDFNIPPCTGNEINYIQEAIDNGKICGDGPFTKKCSEWLREKTGSPFVYMTTSCTHALEMGALLSDVKPGDEVDILLGGRHFVVRVESVQETVRKEDAVRMYTVLREGRDSEDR